MLHTLKDPKWVRENPSARAEDLMEAFSDKNIKAIFATIGGDDSPPAIASSCSQWG